MPNGARKPLPFPSIESREMEILKKDWTEAITTLAKVVFFPVILFWGLVYGAKAGIIKTLEKSLKIMKTEIKGN
jgi:hypothetical protein